MRPTKLKKPLFCFIFIITSLVLFRWPGAFYDSKNQKALNEHLSQTAISHRTYKEEDYQISYITTGDIKKTPLIMLHGSQENSLSFAPLFENKTLKHNFYLVSIDRPGWGKSTYPANQSSYALAEQSKLISPVLRIVQRQSNQPILLLGYGYGGFLASKLAFDNPKQVGGLLILNDILDPKEYDLSTYQKVLHFIPNLFSSKSKENQEILSIKSNLSLLKEQYQQLHLPISILLSKEKVVEGQEQKTSSYLQSLFIHAAPNIKTMSSIPKDMSEFLSNNETIQMIQELYQEYQAYSPR